MMSLEDFARSLIDEVRDPAIREADLNASARAKGDIAAHWRAVLGGRTDELRTLIPDVVDLALFELLDAIDGGRLKLAIWDPESRDWASLEELGRGEMAGWLVGPDGWRERYAKERHTAWIRSGDPKSDDA